MSLVIIHCIVLKSPEGNILKGLSKDPVVFRHHDPPLFRQDTISDVLGDGSNEHNGNLKNKSPSSPTN